MIRVMRQISSSRPPRRAAAVLLAVLLNLALLPCSMALEVVEEGHDCCPPELRLDTADCCEIDEANVGARNGSIKFDSPDFETAAVTALAHEHVAPKHDYLATAGPPGDPPPVVALHKLNCVYLN